MHFANIVRHLLLCCLLL